MSSSSKYCNSQRDCSVGEVCHKTLKKCVPLHCKASSECPQTHYCDSKARACMIRLKLDSYCSDDECADGLLCWEKKCKKICTEDKACPDQLPCTIVDGGVAVCFQPSRPIITASASGTSAVSQDDTMSKIWLIFIVFGCMLFLCFLLYLVMKIMQSHNKRKLVDPEAAHDVAMQVGGPSSSRSISPAIGPKKLKPAPPRSRMSSLRAIPEEQADREEDTDGGIAGVYIASSPSVQSVKALWEQRGKLIASNISTIEMARTKSSDRESYFDKEDNNAVSLDDTDEEETTINHHERRFQSRDERY